MLAGQNIVCLSPNPWDSLWRNRQQIMSRLARQNRVLYVEPASYLRDVAAAGPGGWQRAQLGAPAPNLWVYKPASLAPISGRAPLSTLTLAWRRAALRRTLQRLDMIHPILWVFQYNLGEMIGQIDEKLAIYHAVDEYSAYALNGSDTEQAAQRATIQDMERQVIQQVDLVFVTSPALFESKRSLHPHVMLVPNGVDYDHFTGPTVPPAEMAGLPRPVVGYAGVINEKLDLELVASVATRRPGWSFVLVGPDVVRQERGAITALQELPNVHFFGRRAVAELPAFMQACDACIMPYRHNEWTRNISPLKLYEYLATGVPVVSTSIPAVREFADVVWLADDAETFERALNEALAGDSPERRHHQQAACLPHTWEQRIEALSAAIASRLSDMLPEDQGNGVLASRP